MILIADGGATKTSWLLADTTQNQIFTGEGLSLHYQSEQEVLQELERVRTALGSPQVSEIFYYGSGISNELIADKMCGCLRQVFRPEGTAEARSDLLAACRALLESQPGIACILGTGAASGYFDGTMITEQVPSLGFWLGDEGSGAYLGKELVKAYLRKELGEELTHLFEERFGAFDRHRVFGEMKTNSMPGRYFATFCPFLFENKEHFFVQTMLEQAFRLFVEKNLFRHTSLPNLKIGFVGSVAYYFQGELKAVVADYFEANPVFLREPIERLAAFHAK